MAYINDITINISDGTKALTQTSFIPLIVGSGAVASGVITISELTDITDAGYSTTDAEYEMASAMLAQSPAPSQIKIMRVAGAYDTALTALRTNDDTFYSICIQARDKTNMGLVGTWANSNKKFFFGCSADPGALTGRNVTREAYVIHNNSEYDYPECALVGQNLPKVNTKHINFKWKVLSGQNASTFSSTQLNTIRTNQGIALQEQAGQVFTNAGKATDGSYIDITIDKDWIENELNIGLISLFINNDVIPMDDTGIAQVEGVIRDVLGRAGTQGRIAKAETQADKLKSDDKIYMYTIVVPTRASISANDRANKDLKTISFTYYTAGGIDSVAINGYVTV